MHTQGNYTVHAMNSMGLFAQVCSYLVEVNTSIEDKLLEVLDTMLSWGNSSMGLALVRNWKVVGLLKLGEVRLVE